MESGPYGAQINKIAGHRRAIGVFNKLSPLVVADKNRRAHPDKGIADEAPRRSCCHSLANQCEMTFVCPITSDDLRVIVCVEFDRRASPGDVAAFKNAVIACPLILHSIELSGAFDFMVEAAVPDMASYDERIRSIAQPLASLVSRFEASFVCKRYVRKDEAAEPIWVACDEGLRRIDIGSIDKVTAEGDYMRVHANGSSWMVHTTMHSLEDRLTSQKFIKLHRSTLVRHGFIDRMYRVGSHWVASLVDGSRERVAKSQVSQTLERLRTDSATTEVISPKEPELVDHEYNG